MKMSSCNVIAVNNATNESPLDEPEFGKGTKLIDGVFTRDCTKIHSRI